MGGRRSSKKSKKFHVGYKFFMSVQKALCHGPIDAVREIWVEDKLAWSGNVYGGDINIDNPKLFGKTQGGISGTVHVNEGNFTDIADPRMDELISGVVPPSRGIATMVLRDVYLGNNPYIKPWTILVKRINKRIVNDVVVPQWNPTYAEIGADMNPAHIIREALTDAYWGLGYSDADIDDTSFSSAALALYNENFGLSVLWGSQSSVEDFISNILAHIGAAVYVDRTTGKFVLKLIRNDYGVSYPVFEDTDIIAVEDFQRKPESECVNSVTVIHNDRSKRTTTSITANDIAAIREYGAVNAVTVTYGGVYSSQLASKLASRDLLALSQPVFSGMIRVNRKTASDLNVADVFSIDSDLYPELSGKVFRVMELEIGDSASSPIGIVFSEDVFSLGQGASVSETYDASDLTDPDPTSASNIKVFEMDFYNYSILEGDQTVAENLAYEDERSASIIFTDASSTSRLPSVFYSDISGTFEVVGDVNTQPLAELTTELSADPNVTTCTLSFLYGSSIAQNAIAEGLTQAYIGDELVEVTNIDEFGVATIVRGLSDTIPQKHVSGTKVYFWEYGSEFDTSEFVKGDDINYRIATANRTGVQSVSSSPNYNIIFDGRLDKPWPVNNLAYNGDNYLPDFAGAANLTWANQDKYLLTGDTTPHYLNASTGLEANTTNNVTVTSYSFANTVLATEVSATTTNEFYAIDTGTFNSNAVYATAEVEVQNTVNSKTNHQSAILTLLNPTAPRSAFSSVEYYDSAYYDTTFYTDTAKTTTLGPTDDNVAVAALDTSTGSYTTDLSQATVADRPIFRDAGDAPYGVPYLDFSGAASLDYTGTHTGTLYTYYMRPDGTFGNSTTAVTSGVPAELTFPDTVYQFVLSTTQLNEYQEYALQKHMEQGLVSTVNEWYDAGFWDDTDTWTE